MVKQTTSVPWELKCRRGLEWRKSLFYLNWIRKGFLFLQSFPVFLTLKLAFSAVWLPMKRGCVTRGKTHMSVNYPWISHERYLIRAWGICASESFRVTCVVGTRSVPVAISSQKFLPCRCERWHPKPPASGWVGSLPDAAKPARPAATVADGNHTSICWPSVSLMVIWFNTRCCFALKPLQANQRLSVAALWSRETKEASSIVYLYSVRGQ